MQHHLTVYVHRKILILTKLMDYSGHKTAPETAFNMAAEGRKVILSVNVDQI